MNLRSPNLILLPPSILIPSRKAPLLSLLTTTANVPAAFSAMPRGFQNFAFVLIPFVNPVDPA